jgi:hypothetical protein
MLNKLRYNIDLLNEIVKRYNITLTQDYTKFTTINRKTIITGKCTIIGCNNEFSKSFGSFNNTNGLCDICVKKNKTEQTKKTMIEICKNKVVANQTISYKYNLESLINFTKENDIVLLEDYTKYDTIRKDTKICGKCKSDECVNTFKKGFRQLRLRGGPYCYECTTKNSYKKMEENNSHYNFMSKEEKEIINKKISDKYNDKSEEEKNEIKKKRIETNNKNFGYDIPLQNPDIIKKTIETMLKIYGTKYYTQTDEYKEKMKIINSNKSTEEKNNTIIKRNDTNINKSQEEKNKIKDKIIETMQNNYGVNHYSQTTEFKDKFINTCNNKYGVDNPMYVSDIVDKIKQKYHNKTEKEKNDIREKVKQTNFKKYNVEHISQNPEIAEKQIKNSFLTKEYKLPSKKILKCQGYEPFALDKLIKEDGIGEDDIITSRIEVPEIWYNKQEDQENFKKSRHYVDIFVPSKNLCVEVKSTWTFSKKTEDIMAKQKAGKELGYEYEIWIFDSKGKIINQIK